MDQEFKLMTAHQTQGQFFTLITGASSGIGKAFAEESARRKMNLLLVSLPDTGLEQLTADLAEKYKIKSFCLAIDLTRLDAPKAVYDFARNHDIKVNFLINNAGIGYSGGIESYDQKSIDDMIMLNIRALTLLTHFFIEDLKSFDRSHILNMGSFGSYLPIPFKSIYLASKSYVYYFSMALKSELDDTPVKVTVVVPAGVMTNRATLERIKKAGFFGKATALTAEEVAKIAIKGTLKGKRLIMPGHANKVIFTFMSVLPVRLANGLVKRFFKNNG